MFMQKLTKAEEELMKALWDLEKGFLKEIMENFPGKTPKQSTVSTVLKILEEKGFVSHETFGRTHRYFPLISKDEYATKFLRHFLGDYFDGSFQKMMSFFSKEGNLSMQDIEQLLGPDSSDDQSSSS